MAPEPTADDETEAETMRRTAGVTEPRNTRDVVDHVADYCNDAIDAGIARSEVVIALRHVAREIEDEPEGDR